MLHLREAPQGDDGRGGVLVKAELLYVGHVHALKAPTAYRGYLMVERKRQVPRLGDLTDDEAVADMERLLQVIEPDEPGGSPSSLM